MSEFVPFLPFLSPKDRRPAADEPDPEPGRLHMNRQGEPGAATQPVSGGSTKFAAADDMRNGDYISPFATLLTVM